MAHYFFSDVHLGYGDRESDRRREARLLRFLKFIEPTAESLYIVGDLFDFWFDYKTVIPRGHVRTLAAIGDFVRRGIPVHYSIGNHDFGHLSYFREELHVEMHESDYSTTLNGKRFYISHGDGKALNDTGYLILRAILRSRVSRFLYSLLHPNIAIGFASWTSHSSRGYTDQKDYGPVDGLALFAKKKLSEGYDVVVMGHRHRPESLQEGSGVYVNLGDWMKHCTYGVFDGVNMSLQRFADEG